MEERQWQLQAQAQRLGKRFGRMCPTVFGCRTPSELARVRGGDQHLPGTRRRALPTRPWVTHVQRLGHARLATLGRQVEDQRPATRRRWQWTWVGADPVCKQASQGLGLVGTWWSGREPRVRQGIAGLRLVGVIGNGQPVLPVDFPMRRPDPVGPGRPCHNQLTWLQVRLERTWAALPRRRLQRPAPLVVAERWFGASTLLAPVALPQHGTWLVEGKPRSVLQLSDRRQGTGQDLRTWPTWPWRDSLRLPGRR